MVGLMPIEEMVYWPESTLHLTSYLSRFVPPLGLVTSVRAVVLKEQQVLGVRDPDRVHILPGGRREASESLLETVKREVLEETGWLIVCGPMLGVRHFHFLTGKPAGYPYPYPDFFQVVYQALAVEHRPESKEQNGFELDSGFISLAQVAHQPISPAERMFLAAALGSVGQKGPAGNLPHPYPPYTI